MKLTRALLLALLGLCSVALAAQQPPAPQPLSKPLNIPPAPLGEALTAFAQQSGLQIILDAKLAEGVKSRGVSGTHSAQAAIALLLAQTPFRAEWLDGHTIAIRPIKPDDKSPARQTGADLEPGDADAMLLAQAVTGEAGKRKTATASADGVEEMLVEGEREQAPVRAGGNLDLRRTEQDVLPFQVFTREDITRSGVTELNMFLQQNLLSNSDVSNLAPEESIQSTAAFNVSGSSNINLRGYGQNQTVILVNGRRAPRTTNTSAASAPNLNAIPLSMVERIEVLSATASAIYGANAVGGVINIVLRDNYELTEATATYNNALGGYDAARKSFGLMHGQSVLGGKLSFRLNANRNEVTPPTEQELGYMRTERLRREARTPSALTANVFGATPNIRSSNNSPLFGTGTSSVTSVAPGADGSGGLAAFTGRSGVRNFGFFDGDYERAPGGNYMRATYGRQGETDAYAASLLYRPLSWMELSLDGSYSKEAHFAGLALSPLSLTVAATSPVNPFNQIVRVSFYDAPWAWGEDYNRSSSRTTSIATGALFKFPREWQLALDAQQSRSTSTLRQATINPGNLTTLVNQGLYNPFRDTQLSLPPQVFYDRAVQYYVNQGGTRDAGARAGEYRTDEYSLRLTNQRLPLPAGPGVLVVGANYQRAGMGNYTREARFGDGSLVGTEDQLVMQDTFAYNWGVYGELIAPLLPERWLTRGLVRKVEGDIAFRYAGSDTFKSSPNPPTFGVKLGLISGFTLRGAYTSAYRAPYPSESIVSRVSEIYTATASDPRRGGEVYEMTLLNLGAPQNPDLLPEDGATVTFGLLFQRGQVHRFSAAFDYVRTRKTNEITTISYTGPLDVEQYLPQLVQREAPQPGDPYGVGRVISLTSRYVNVLGRNSTDWSGDLNYAWTRAFGGELSFNVRGFYFPSYRTQFQVNAPVVQNIENPDGSFPNILKYRASAGVSWFRREFGFGMNGRYYNPRTIYRSQWVAQGAQRIDRYMEFDAYVQGDLSSFVPWNRNGNGLRGTLAINNVFGAKFPFLASDMTGVAAYGDWRGRVISLSLTASF